MNYEQLLELLRNSGGSRSIDTPAELKMRMGSLIGNRYGSRSIDTPAEAEMRGITADAFGGGRDSSALDTAIKDSYYTTVRPEYRDSRELNTAVERAMRLGTLTGLYSPSMAAIIRGFVRGVPSGYGRDDTRASLQGLLGNKEATQAILRSILGQ